MDLLVDFPPLEVNLLSIALPESQRDLPPELLVQDWPTHDRTLKTHLLEPYNVLSNRVELEKQAASPFRAVNHPCSSSACQRGMGQYHTCRSRMPDPRSEQDERAVNVG